MPTKGEYLKGSLPIPKKMPTLCSAARGRGFGFFRYSLQERKIRNQAKQYAEQMLKGLDEYLSHEFGESEEERKDKANFLYDLQYYLGGIIAATSEVIGDGHKWKRIPRRWYKDREAYYNQNLGMQWYPFFDHFAQRGHIFVSNPYDVSSETLREALKWADERGFRFDLTADSNYFPYHSLQVRFYETKNTPKVKEQTGED